MPTIVKSVDVSGVNLDIYEGPVGIKVSGGADSAILLYNLMKHKNDETIHIFTTGNNQRNRHNVTVSGRVVERCIQLTGNSNIEHHISYCDVQSFETLFPKLRVWFENGTVDMMYTGLTSNPPVEVSGTFSLPITEEKRNPGIEKPVLQYDNKFYMPWINIDKSKIADMYRDCGMMDSLYSTTRSCEYDPTSNYFKNIDDPELGHCGICWWCEERQWAFGRLQ